MYKKILLVLICIMCFSVTSTYARCKVTKTSNSVLNKKECFLDAPQSSIKYKRYINRIKNERATVYNALNLTDEQIKIRESLSIENEVYYEAKFEELMKESFKLKALKTAGASESEINKQKKLLKKIKKDIDETIDKEFQDFYKILTKDQKSKFSTIKKLEKRDFNSDFSKKDFYKSNPQMRPFGNPTSSPSPIGRKG